MKKLVIDVGAAMHAELKANAQANGVSMTKLVLDGMSKLKAINKFTDDDKLTVIDPASGKPVTLMFV
ncbi:MAG TPA: hypothetical protein VLH56_18635 [Dissulfurispiraceae bacterium]|nr:hypothetical protein [Dissulfurispiraceae bacterium]